MDKQTESATYPGGEKRMTAELGIVVGLLAGITVLVLLIIINEGRMK